MQTRILVPMDDSDMAEQALEYALEFHPDAEITVLHVVGEPSPMWGKATGLAVEEDLEEVAQEYAAPVVDRARDIAAEHDVEIETNVQVGNPVRAILNLAENFDTIVLGSHGGSVADWLFLGNVTQKVVRGSPVPVTVVR